MTPVYLLSTVLMIGYAAVFTLLAQMRNAFGFDETAVGALAAVAFFAGFIAQVGLSRYADAGYGRQMLQIGTLTAILGSVWMVFADSLWAWLLARMLLGFGAGCVRPCLRRLAFVRDPARAGETLGRLAAWEMVGFLIGPVLASVLFAGFGIRAPFIAVTVLLVLIVPFVFRVDVPGSDNPLPRVMSTLLKRPAMQSCIGVGIAFYMAVGVFDAIWAVFMADLGASQMFIGVTMSLFTLPMILVAPWGGRLATRRHVLNLITVTMSLAMLAMLCYGVLSSPWWMIAPLLIHALADAVGMPATQYAVGYASGENALAAGQGLFGAIGLVVAALASIGSGFVYQHWGVEVLWFGSVAVMVLAIGFAQWRGRGQPWQSADLVGENT